MTADELLELTSRTIPVEELKSSLIDKMQLNPTLDSVINAFMVVVEQEMKDREIAKYKVAVELMRDFENIKSRLKVDTDWQTLIWRLKGVKEKFVEEMKDKDFGALRRVMEY